jgi:hypothetical protein
MSIGKFTRAPDQYGAIALYYQSLGDIDATNLRKN